MPELRTEIDDAPATRRDRILAGIIWAAVVLFACAVWALIVEAFK